MYRIHCTHRKLHFMNIKFTNNWKKKEQRNCEGYFKDVNPFGGRF